MMECWNNGLTSKISVQSKGAKTSFTQYSIIPIFQYSVFFCSSEGDFE